MADSTRLNIVVTTPLGIAVALAAAKQMDAQAAWVRAKGIADSITAGGVTKANLEVADVAATQGTAYYDLIAAAKTNADNACTQLKQIDQGVIV